MVWHRSLSNTGVSQETLPLQRSRPRVHFAKHPHRLPCPGGVLQIESERTQPPLLEQMG